MSPTLGFGGQFRHGSHVASKGKGEKRTFQLGGSCQAGCSCAGASGPRSRGGRQRVSSRRAVGWGGVGDEGPLTFVLTHGTEAGPAVHGAHADKSPHSRTGSGQGTGTGWGLCMSGTIMVGHHCARLTGPPYGLDSPSPSCILHVWGWGVFFYFDFVFCP